MANRIRQRRPFIASVSPCPSDTKISLPELVARLAEQETDIRLGGGQAAIDRQHKKKRLTARERIDRLIDPDTVLFELGLWAAWGMYGQWGARAGGGCCHRHWHGQRPSTHDYRQRRYRKSRCILSRDCKENFARSADCYAKSAAANLSGRLSRHFSCRSKKTSSPTKMISAHISQQRSHFRGRLAANCGDHGQLCGWWRLFARLVR